MSTSTRVRGRAASPLARRVALTLGVDLAQLEGSGPNGRIVRRDVERAAAAPRPAAATPAVAGPPAASAGPAPSGRGAVATTALTRTQRTVALRMAQAKATVPEFAVEIAVDMGAAVALRGELKQALGAAAPSFNDMVVKACALALRTHPQVNGCFADDRFERWGDVNVGIAVAGEGTLVVPTIRNADARPLSAIASEARRLAAAVRGGTIAPAELADGTFTVSNLGMFGVTRFQPIVNPPQAAILGVGALRDCALVRDGALVAGVVADLTLTADHRVLYGADAARFLATVRELLEAPLRLLL